MSPHKFDLHKPPEGLPYRLFVDVCSDAQFVQQAGGRLVRIGQRSAYIIYILTLDHTYDQYLQAVATGKMIGIIASHTNHNPAAKEGKAWRAQHDDDDNDDDETPEVQIRDLLIHIGGYLDNDLRDFIGLMLTIQRRKIVCPWKRSSVASQVKPKGRTGTPAQET